MQTRPYMRKVVNLLVLGVLVSGCADGGGGITVGTHLDSEFGAGGTGPTAPGDVTTDPLAAGYAQWWLGLSGPADLAGAPATQGRPRFEIRSAVLTLPQSAGAASRLADLRLGDWLDHPAPLTSPADAPLLLAASKEAPIVVEVVGLLDDGLRQWTTPLVIEIVVPLIVHTAPIEALRRQLLLNEPALQDALAQPLHACALATTAPDSSTVGNPDASTGSAWIGNAESGTPDPTDPPVSDPRSRDAATRSADTVAGAPAEGDLGFAPSASEHPACVKAHDDAVALLLESSSWTIVGLPDAP
jgi:hypothetical protein